MTRLDSGFSCAACGAEVADTEPLPFVCPNRTTSPEIEHVLRCRLDVAGVELAGEPNPFVRYRELTHTYRFARRHGMDDRGYCDLVNELDQRVADVAGSGFGITPCIHSAELARELGVADVVLKDETAGVGGTHKGRHVFGLALWLTVVDRLGLADVRSRRLAIASCGNAALAAAIVAKALAWPLMIYVPDDADPAVVDRLHELGAQVGVCVRGGDRGDPCVLALRSAVLAGYLPFTCQGRENALAIEGGQTLIHELAGQIDDRIDRVAVQVGGGALMSAVVRGVDIETRLGRLSARPRFHAVQTAGSHPLERAFEVVRERAESSTPEAALGWALTHPDQVMRPWAGRPRSIAHAILDDETYDWLDPVDAMLATGGSVVVVNDPVLEEAVRAVRSATGIRVDPTGAAGFAGLLALARAGRLGSDERVLVLLTGGQR